MRQNSKEARDHRNKATPNNVTGKVYFAYGDAQSNKDKTCRGEVSDIRTLFNPLHYETIFLKSVTKESSIKVCLTSASLSRRGDNLAQNCVQIPSDGTETVLSMVLRDLNFSPRMILSKYACDDLIMQQRSRNMVDITINVCKTHNYTCTYTVTCYVFINTNSISLCSALFLCAHTDATREKKYSIFFLLYLGLMNHQSIEMHRIKKSHVLLAPVCSRV